MKTKAIILSSTMIVTAGAAFAGSPTPTMPEPAPMQPPVVVQQPMGTDWTGAYAGLSFGSARVDAADDEETSGMYGVHAGYDYDFGSFVLGGELEYSSLNDLEVGGADVDSVTRLKLRAGADLGQFMVYGTAGAARVDTSIGEETGPVGGLGVEYMATDNLTIGAEYLAHRFEDIDDTDVDADADTISLRGSFRF
ncbi:outer membrane protein [Citreimonas sp.]|uniref:outer membrane protein n=1 Tax=Citreimonas sp. TaxID=3036715 RepID=UPI0035C85893